MTNERRFSATLVGGITLMTLLAIGVAAAPLIDCPVCRGTGCGWNELVGFESGTSCTQCFGKKRISPYKRWILSRNGPAR